MDHQLATYKVMAMGVVPHQNTCNKSNIKNTKEKQQHMVNGSNVGNTTCNTNNAMNQHWHQQCNELVVTQKNVTNQ
jgi:hypothetical protein